MARQTRPTRPSKASLNPNTRSLEWQAMSYKWWLYNTCMGGTAALRDSAQELLPKHTGETQEDYNDRLQTSVFTNFTRMTMEFLVGKPFAEKVQFRDNTPISLTAMEQDMDGAGNDLTTVCMDFFMKGLGKGFSYLMVEYPQLEGPVSVAVVQQQNIRPYWCVYDPDNIIEARAQLIDGKMQWVHVRIFDPQLEYDGFEQVIVNYIRMYELVDIAQPDQAPVYRVRFTIFKEDKPNSNKWDVFQAATMTTAPLIPLVRFNSTPDGSMSMEDLLYNNIGHFQSLSDQRACLKMSRFPILGGAGVDSNKSYLVGPHEMLLSSDPQSKFYYVESQGTAIGVGAKDIEGFEGYCAMYGAQMLKKRPDRETATSRIVDETQNMAPLQIMVLQFMSAMETVCDYTLMWIDQSSYEDNETYGVNVNLDFAMSADNERMMGFFENARLQGDVSRIQFFAVAKELGYVPDAFNAQLNDSQLKAEQAADLEFQQSVIAAKGQQGNNGSGTGSPADNPNDPKIKRQNTPAVGA